MMTLTSLIHRTRRWLKEINKRKGPHVTRWLYKSWMTFQEWWMRACLNPKIKIQHFETTLMKLIIFWKFWLKIKTETSITIEKIGHRQTTLHSTEKWLLSKMYISTLIKILTITNRVQQKDSGTSRNWKKLIFYKIIKSKQLPK